ncbi:MAG: NHLP leader peptide family RiPP precursor [Verrucomicrobiae bacterium]|nr:NHLP leader peptide family RiPP precursor [Verrucomicrobiae bacterium]
MATKELTRCEIEEIVVKNAAKYRKYRRMLLENPKKTIEMQLNNTLPENVIVELIQESPNRIFVCLPHVVEHGSELSDEDLEQIAGGKGGGDTYPCNEKSGGFNTRNEYNVGL